MVQAAFRFSKIILTDEITKETDADKWLGAGHAGMNAATLTSTTLSYPDGDTGPAIQDITDYVLDWSSSVEIDEVDFTSIDSEIKTPFTGRGKYTVSLSVRALDDVARDFFYKTTKAEEGIRVLRAVRNGKTFTMPCRIFKREFTASADGRQVLNIDLVGVGLKQPAWTA